MSNRLPFRLLAVSLALSLTVGVSLSSASGMTVTDDPSGAAAASKASDALARARALFADPTSLRQRRAARAGSGRNATMVLTDLAQRVDALDSSADRRAARALLARPSYQGTPSGDYEHSYRVPERTPLCDGSTCVHYVTSTGDAVSSADANADGIPDYVRTVQSTLATVWATEITKLGYRKPASDAALSDNGGNGQLDVYLQDMPFGVYGYCVPETDRKVAPGYCVLDNDYKSSQYQTNTPTQNLQVTAAHEFFHAIQFAYDSYEDAWLMEGTAAWMEDEVFDGVNDNWQYLSESQLSNPEIPLDYTDYDQYQPYGAWLFWRFLSEWAGAGSRDDPSIVRQTWYRAGADRNSTSALGAVLATRRTSFAQVYTAFGTWLRNPRIYFSEGSSYRPTGAPLDWKLTLGNRNRTTGNRSTRLDHMTHSFARLIPGSSLTGTWRLRINVNLADTVRGSKARVTVHRQDGSLGAYNLSLSRYGNGGFTAKFSRSVVRYVEVDMVNASTRFRCNQGTYQTCAGDSYDDGLTATFNATALR